MDIEKVLSEFFVFEDDMVKNRDKKKAKRIYTDIDIIKWLGDFSDDKDLDWSKNYRQESLKKWKENTKSKNNEIVDVDNFVQRFMIDTCTNRNIVLRNNGKFTLDGIYVDDFDIEEIFCNDSYDWNRNNQNQRISVPEIKSAISVMKIDKNKNTIKEITEKIAYDVDCEKYLEEFLKITHNTFCIAEDFDVFCVIMKQVMWMVKRRILTRSTINQIFLNFFGKGGTGKTYFIKLFTKPFGENRVLNAKIETVQDERRIPELSKNFIHFLDELSGEKKFYRDSELGIFKQVISTDEPLTYRQLGTHNSQKIHSRTTLIGCSNFHIFDTINDVSGMRKFFEFCITIEPHKYNKADFNRLEEIVDYAWKGIDEEKDEGYLNFNNEIGEKVQDIQMTYVRQESFDLWVESIDIKPGKTKGPDAYKMYNDYCEEEGLEFKQKSIPTFYTRLRSIGVKVYRSMGYTYVSATITKKNDEERTKLTETNFLKEIGITISDEAPHASTGKFFKNLGGIQ